MPRFTLSTLVAVAVVSSKVYAQNSTSSALIPLASKHFDYDNLVRSVTALILSNVIPNPVCSDSHTKLTQTTASVAHNPVTTGATRQPRTRSPSARLPLLTLLTVILVSSALPRHPATHVNLFLDFCLWAPPDGPTTIGETEHEEVAWCTKPGHGTRLIPAGALQGVQFMKTPDYVQVVGFIDQRFINLKPDDFGGELDPHGADFRGNPLGGLFYSTAWSSDKTTYEQVIEWNNFMGGNSFCLKACDPAGPNAARFCEHIYDRIGCAYNSPNSAQNGTFESCSGDNQDFPGIYTDASGQVQTYTQPPESLGAISSMPYTAKIPASSNCVTFTSSAIYAALPTATGILPSSSGSSSGVSSRSTGTKTSGGSGPSNTAGGSNSGSAAGLKVGSAILSFGVGAVGVVFAVLALA